MLATPAQAAVRPQGLGQISRVGDEQVLEFLSFLHVRELAAMGTCSRAFCVFDHHADLWRNLALYYCGGGRVSVPFSRIWKDTCARAFQLVAPSGGPGAGAGVHAVVPHEPMRVDGVFSDALFRPWWCSSAEVPARWLEGGNQVPRRAGLSVAAFVAEYERPNLSVVLTDVAAHWPALEKWDHAYLSACCGEALFRATSLGATRAASFTMRDYAAYQRAFEGGGESGGEGGGEGDGESGGEGDGKGGGEGDGENGGGKSGASPVEASKGAEGAAGRGGGGKKTKKKTKEACEPGSEPGSACSMSAEEAPLYLFERSFHDLAPQLGSDYQEPPHFRPDAEHGSDLFSVLGEVARPDHRWLIAGPKRSGSVFHIDPNATNAW